jgi:hypothetical protein
MKKFYTEKYLSLKPVCAESADDAAQIFADRLARRVWGATGNARQPRREYWSTDSVGYEAALCGRWNKSSNTQPFVNKRFSVYWD